MPELQGLIRRHGVKSCYRALVTIHRWDPDIAYLALWYARMDKKPTRMHWGFETDGIDPAPISETQAQEFLDLYTEKRFA